MSSVITKYPWVVKSPPVEDYCSKCDSLRQERRIDERVHENHIEKKGKLAKVKTLGMCPFRI
jgi:hypothetical protein